MADVQHNALTGASLHEPKGVAAASADTVYVANGAGSGSWVKIDKDNIDTTSIPSVNRTSITHEIGDLQTASTRYMPIPFNCTVVHIATALDTALVGADAVLTFFNGVGGAQLGTSTVTITQSGSAPGDYDSSTPSTNNTFNAGDVLEIKSDGGPTAAAECHLIVTVEWS